MGRCLIVFACTCVFFMLFGKDLKESLFFKKKPAQSVESDRPGDIFVAL